VELTVKISKAQLPSQWTSGAGLPTISVPESLADCLSNDAFNYTYTDEAGNTVSKSEMVAGKKYNVKATLKPEYAGNFEFVDASGIVLPDASVSTSHEFSYSDGSNDGSSSEDGEWYKKLLTLICIMLGLLIFIMFMIMIFVAVIMRRMGQKSAKKPQQISSKTKAADSEEE
ncbi:MAG: hypothetical protein HFH71_04930, partial [Clostridia bacterium]|nr:hypothetical protein [Clostridia bacterium]